MNLLRVIVATGISLFGILFLAFVAASPLGWVSAYPAMPEKAINREWGEIIPIKDVKSLYKKKDEETTTYYKRLVNAVFEGIGRFWVVGKGWQPSDAIYTRVSPWDNYLLWGYSFLPGHEHFAQYEFAIPQKTIDRGYGFCSQVARMVYYILHDQGIKATVKHHPNHVIVAVDEGIIDANYGVFVPHTTEQMRDNQQIIETYYNRLPKELPAVRRIFSEMTGKWRVPTDHDALYAYMMRVEVIAEIFKWFPPVFLILAGPFLLFASSRRNKLSIRDKAVKA
ncbi:MAG TPA: hypothetical protein DD400_01535 [Rhodospirillaceae bacterium]|nr:hypothetical protein [Rhodospirillaceae bacterium]